MTMIDCSKSIITFILFWQSKCFCNWHIYNYRCRGVAMVECIWSPKVMAKAQAELDNVVGKSRRVEDVDIPNTKYLQVVIKKALQLHHATPLLIPHMNKKACKMFKYNLPARTMVLVNVGGLAWDPKLWEDPLELKPERFLEGMPHANTNIRGKHIELVPFRSRCWAYPDVSLATMSMHWLWLCWNSSNGRSQTACNLSNWICQTPQGASLHALKLLLQFQRLTCLLFCDKLEA